MFQDQKVIEKQREIIDRRVLLASFEKMASWSGISNKNRSDVLKVFKKSLISGNNEIRRRFEFDRVSGSYTIRAHAFLIDQLVRVLFDVTANYVYPAPNPTIGEQISVVATGGYGRGELAPFSDIDLMFLFNYKRTPRTEQLIEYMLYMLWDLGLKVGHSTRSINEAIKLSNNDITIRTSLLEARFLCGEEPLYLRFKKKFSNSVETSSGRDFVDSKLAERDMRHERMGDTRYVLEPNIKEGKGGLRDLHTLFWIAKYLYRVNKISELVKKNVLTDKDAKRFTKAQNFLWTVRIHLHYVSGRAEERLTFNVQNELAMRMAYKDHVGARGVERFMKHYFLIAKDVGDLTRIICAVLEAEQKKRRFSIPWLPFVQHNVRGFRAESGRLKLETDDAFKKQPLQLLTLFAEAQRLELDIHPSALRAVTQSLKLIDRAYRENSEANRVFIEIILSKKDPELALKRMNEAGVLGRFIPEFGRVVAQMQYDMYHVYTVDEHTIRAIGILAQLERGDLSIELQVASNVVGEVQSRISLYLSLLLHDIAKGRGGDHSEIGSHIASRLCPRLGLNNWETETVSWLVRHHLAMSDTAFKRDLDDQKTIIDFADLVQSPERLRLLYILTVCDIRAVGPDVWNGWKAQLLSDLYYSSLEHMSGTITKDVRVNKVLAAKQAFREQLSNWTEADLNDFIDKCYDDYWIGYDTFSHIRHAQLVANADKKNKEITIEECIDDKREVTEIIIYTYDHPGVFAQIAGAMSLTNATIVDARISTLGHGMALDTFWIQDASGGPFKKREGLARLKKNIVLSLNGRLQPSKRFEEVRAQTMRNHINVFQISPKVMIDNTLSAKYTVIEVNGRDRIGFLSDATEVLTNMGLQIASAHISTYGERVVDVFYVKDVFGLRVEHAGKIALIKRTLLDAIDSSNGEKKVN